MVLLLAFVGGAAAANLYYAQPLLHTIGGAFSVSESTAGLLVTASQGGYVAGRAVLGRLGALHERRRLITAAWTVAALAQACAAAAPAFAPFALALAVAG